MQLDIPQQDLGKIRLGLSLLVSGKTATPQMQSDFRSILARLEKHRPTHMPAKKGQGA